MSSTFLPSHPLHVHNFVAMLPVELHRLDVEVDSAPQKRAPADAQNLRGLGGAHPEFHESS